MAGTNTRSVVQFIILLGIGVLLIWLSLREVAPEKDKIYEAFANANYMYIYACMGISFLSHFFRAYRWNYLLKPLGYEVKLFNATCHVIVGYFANYGIPRMGELTRCTLAAKYDKVPFEVGFGTVITERIVDFILFLVIFVLTLAFQFSELIGLSNELIFDKLNAKLAGLSTAKIISLSLIVLIIVAAFLMLRKKIANLLKGKLGGILKGMAEGIGSVRKMKNPIRFIVLSILIWACYFYSLYMCFFALTGTAHLGQKECLILLLFGTFGVIFSPGGLGAYPAIVGGILLYTFHVDKASAFALPWLSWTSQFVLIVILGIFSLISLPLYNKKRMLYHKLLKDKILSKETVKGRIIALRNSGKEIVFTNGCFDLLHPGHVDYLSQARDMGDYLIVGLNTDASVKKLEKAPGRPINNENTRAMVLSGLGCVDAIVLFDEETPYELIKFLEPDVLVKGNDYKVEQIAGFDLVQSRGGKVITIPLLQGYSTSSIIEKIKS